VGLYLQGGLVEGGFCPAGMSIRTPLGIGQSVLVSHVQSTEWRSTASLVTAQHHHLVSGQLAAWRQCSFYFSHHSTHFTLMRLSPRIIAQFSYKLCIPRIIFEISTKSQSCMARVSPGLESTRWTVTVRLLNADLLTLCIAGWLPSIDIHCSHLRFYLSCVVESRYFTTEYSKRQSDEKL